MSSNLLKSTGEGSNRKRSTSPIRKYLIKPSTNKPLSCSNDNIVKNTTDAIVTEHKATKPKAIEPKAIKPTNIPTLKNTQTSRSLLDLMQATKKSQSTSNNKSNEIIPGSLKRSHSAISHLDTVNESWMSAPLTSKQKTTVDKKETYDRLAPGITDMLSAQVIINKSSLQSTTNYPEPISNGGSESYREQVAKACGIEPSKRILSFAPSPPSSKRVNIHKNPPQATLMAVTPKEIKRRILTSPEKILDAPYITDDYYLNNLDWSRSNVVAIGLNKSVYLWNADNGDIQALNYDYDDPVASVSWSPDSLYLAVGTTSGDTQIWDVQSNTKLRSMTGQNCRIGVLSWDKHLISSGGRDGSIWHHDVRVAKHNVKQLYGHADEVCGLKWRWDGQLLASGGNDNTVNIWDARSTTPKFTKNNHIGAVKALAWCPWNHNILATGGGRDDKNIHFWNTLTGARMNTIYAGSQVTSLHWSQHHKEIASTHGLPHNQITVWGYPTLNKIIDIPAHESRILHSSMSPDGQVLATAAADDNLKFWRIFESNGKARLRTENSRLTEKKELQIRRSKTIR